MILRTYGIYIGLAVLANTSVGCGIETPDTLEPGLADVTQANHVNVATWGNPIVVDSPYYGSDCRPTGVVDRGIFGGEHHFEFYGDFRCGHSFSFPTPIYQWQCSLAEGYASARTTYTGTYQVNTAFTVPREPFTRCYVSISSWNQQAGTYELIL
jgi:hypothetical protein